jgi:acetyl esterase/lipase
MKLAIKAALALTGCILLFAFASAAEPEHPVVQLYDGAAPGSEDWTQKEGAVDVTNPTLDKAYVDTVVWNVTRPTLTVFRPAKGKSNGTAIVIAPGGGFRVLSFRNEGLKVAQYMAERGVTAFVLKYRLNRMPDDPAEVKGALDKMAAAGAVGGPKPGVAPAGPPPAMPAMVLGPVEKLGISDGGRAVEWVRAHAADYGIDVNRVGIIGFSAGGVVSGGTAVAEGHRPDFVGIIYSNVAGTIPAGAPPAFMAAAEDDGLSAAMPDLFTRWRAAGSVAEIHIYAKGHHGFGMAQQGLPVDHWIDSFWAWLQQQGFVAGEAPAKH